MPYRKFISAKIDMICRLSRRNGVNMNSISRDTIRLTAVSFLLQGMGLGFNIYMSNKLGTASVGIMSLIFSFFGFIMVLANGNIFLSTSRSVSEEIGAGNRNVSRVMKYSFCFSAALSVFFASLSYLSAGFIAENFIKDPNIGLAIRIIALSLPLASAGSCIKGYFNAIRKIQVPCAGDIIEFTTKWASLLLCVIFLLDRGLSIYVIISCSILIGEAVSCIFYVAAYNIQFKKFSGLPETTPRIKKIPSYFKISIPVMLSGYVHMTMATLNDALVPIALLKFNASPERALSEYGMFEAMIIPVIFFPAVVPASMSSIIIPEIARANSAGAKPKVRRLISDAWDSAFSYAFIAAGLLFAQGKNIGTLICQSDPLVGNALKDLFLVVPFIYLEIILEGILKGLGKQNFSTVNSLCEYTIRILCVIIFVHFYGFTGILISYYASNIFSNIARMVMVCKTAEMKFDAKRFLLKPAAQSVFCCLASFVLVILIKPERIFIETAIYLSSAILIYALVFKSEKKPPEKSGSHGAKKFLGFEAV